MYIKHYAFISNTPDVGFEAAASGTGQPQPVVAVTATPTRTDPFKLQVSIDQDAAQRLITALYYTKAEAKSKLATTIDMKAAYRELMAPHTRSALFDECCKAQLYINENLPAAGQCGMAEWVDMTRRFGFSRVSDELRVAPVAGAVKNQALRCQYVVMLVYEATSTAQSTVRDSHTSYGWCSVNDKVQVDWGVPNTPATAAAAAAAAAAASAGGGSGAGAPHCGCKKSCSNNRCPCRAANRQCAQACRCAANGGCHNGHPNCTPPAAGSTVGAGAAGIPAGAGASTSAGVAAQPQGAADDSSHAAAGTSAQLDGAAPAHLGGEENWEPSDDDWDEADDPDGLDDPDDEDAEGDEWDDERTEDEDEDELEEYDDDCEGAFLDGMFDDNS
jgi:hypothetical protein